MKPLEAIRCTLPNCNCECFSPSKTQLRICETCRHGWVTHALDKLGPKHLYTLGMQVEIVQPNIVFDIASLMLYGTQATPIRLKILLDRLFSVLQHDEVIQVLHGFGWSYEDYARGYILQNIHGRVLDKWTVVHREEEHVILQQFLRFGETKTIAQEIIMQDTRDKQHHYVAQTSRAESEIKKFIERTNLSNYSRVFDARNLVAARLPFIPAGSRMVTPTILHGVTVSSGVNSTAIELRNVSQVPALIAPTPLTASPLGKLRTMQPFDFRKDALSSPSVSPGSSFKRSSVPSSCDSPTNLTLNLSKESSYVTPQKIKVETSLENDVMKTPDKDIMISNEGIDYSSKETNISLYEIAKKERHNRKSTNPIKRHWTPSASFGNTLISPSGKKRVLCIACNKTFCDKGALKIHYSAVHLKEMHKCTVGGCNMMFSSRRSRNRHSANPNPKLHMPQPKRPKSDGFSNSSNDCSPVSQPLMALPECLTSIDETPSCQSNQIKTAAHFSTPEKKICIDSLHRQENESISGNHEEIENVENLQLKAINKRKCMMPTKCALSFNGNDKEVESEEANDMDINDEGINDDDTVDALDSEEINDGSDSDGICFREGEILEESTSEVDDSPQNSPAQESYAANVELFKEIDKTKINGSCQMYENSSLESDMKNVESVKQKCYICALKFTSENDLRAHQETAHFKIRAAEGRDLPNEITTRENALNTDEGSCLPVQDVPLSLVVNGNKKPDKERIKPSTKQQINISGSVSGTKDNAEETQVSDNNVPKLVKPRRISRDHFKRRNHISSELEERDCISNERNDDSDTVTNADKVQRRSRNNRSFAQENFSI